MGTKEVFLVSSCIYRDPSYVVEAVRYAHSGQDNEAALNLEKSTAQIDALVCSIDFRLN